MSKATIRTNNQFRETLHFYELPEKVQEEKKEDYDAIEESTFFKYKNYYYDLSDFPRFDTPWTGKSPFPDNWHAYRSDSFFSGILVELSDCGEMVKIGNYCT